MTLRTWPQIEGSPTMRPLARAPRALDLDRDRAAARAGGAEDAAVGSTAAFAAPTTFGSNAYEYVEVADPYTGSNNS